LGLPYDREALEAMPGVLLEPVLHQLLAADGGDGYQAFPIFIPQGLYKTMSSTKQYCNRTAYCFCCLII
jgi:hypothetical protein